MKKSIMMKKEKNHLKDLNFNEINIFPHCTYTESENQQACGTQSGRVRRPQKVPSVSPCRTFSSKSGPECAADHRTTASDKSARGKEKCTRRSHEWWMSYPPIPHRKSDATSLRAARYRPAVVGIRDLRAPCYKSKSRIN